MRRVRLRVIECGHCRHPEAMTLRGAAWRPVEFPSLVGVIEHPDEGVVLFDTGYDPLFLAATSSWPERLYRLATPMHLRPKESAVEQLASLGYGPEAVRHIVISHFHGDHVAGLHRFPRARLHCARAGLADVRAGSRLRRTRRGILSAFVPAAAEAAAFFEDGSPAELPGAFRPFDRGVDLLGDGSLLAIELPGHCRGHWGLALRLEDDRWVMMVADAAWSATAIAHNRPPPAATTALLGDTAAYRRTLTDLHRVHRERPETVLLPSHCRSAATTSALLA